MSMRTRLQQILKPELDNSGLAGNVHRWRHICSTFSITCANVAHPSWPIQSYCVGGPTTSYVLPEVSPHWFFVHQGAQEFGREIY